MITNNILNEILINPINNNDELLILCGYATPAMASWYIKHLEENNLPTVKQSIIIGMCPSIGISCAIHSGFILLQKEKESIFQCSYIYKLPPIHANIYIWKNDNALTRAFCGSADFIQKSFLSGQIEVMCECDPYDAYAIYNKYEKNSIYCTNIDVDNEIQINEKNPFFDFQNSSDDIIGQGTDKITLSLLTKTGNVGTTSGLNWGQRKGREKNQAYIPYNKKYRKDNFFPQQGHFTVLTDDGCSLILRLEQENNKAITTPLRNADLGEYFRNRLGLPNGALIKKDDLIKYGRTDVTFYKLDDENFYMDFSSNNK